METFLLNLLKTSLLGSLAILAMLVLKPLWRERYRAKTRCWLWLALAVFLLLPVDFSVKNAPVQAAPPKDYTLFVGTDKTTIQSTDNLFGDMAEKSGQSPAQVRDTIIQRPVTNPEQKTTRYIPVTTILFYGYLAGAAAFLLYQGVSYALFRRTVRRWKRDVSRADYASLLSDTARDLGVSAPEMIVCEAISTPAVTGLLRPRLLLPHEHYDVQELRYILRHELCHLKRRDMLLKLVLLAANAMHWFNPVVYLMLRQADEDIELACDSAATDGLELPERAAYSRTLLAAVQSSVRALPATTCFGGTVERLKRRITNVLGAQKKRGLGVVALVLALTLTAGCAVGWGERAQTQKNDDPFADKSYTVDILLYEAPAFTDGFTDGTYPSFRTTTNTAGEKYVTLCDAWGSTSIYGPMEEYTLEKQSFYALFGSTKGLQYFCSMIYPKTFENKIGFDEIRSLLRERCLSTLGKEMVDNIGFSDNADAISEWLQQIREFRRLQEEADDFPMQYFFDVREAVSRLRLEGTHLEESKLFDLRRSLETICNIVNYLNRTEGEDDDSGERTYPYPALHRLTTDVMTFPQLTQSIDRILDKYGKIKDSASPELLNIRRELARTEGGISRTLNAILRSAQSEEEVLQSATGVW